MVGQAAVGSHTPPRSFCVRAMIRMHIAIDLRAGRGTTGRTVFHQSSSYRDIEYRFCAFAWKASCADNFINPPSPLPPAFQQPQIVSSPSPCPEYRTS